jgi:hypothetical protein
VRRTTTDNAGMTPMKERRGKGRKKGSRLQCSSKKVLLRPKGSLNEK